MPDIATIDSRCTCRGGSDTHVVSGARKLYVNGKPVARISDRVTGNEDHGEHSIAEGYHKLVVEGQPAAYVGAKINCGGSIATGQSKLQVKGS